MIIILISRIAISIYKFEFKYKEDDSYSKMEVVVLSLEKIDSNKVSYLVKYNSDRFLLNIYSDENSSDLDLYDSFKYGDILVFSGKIVIPKKLGNPYEFDYKRYLNSNNICGTISTNKVKKNNEISLNIIDSVFFSYKEKLEECINTSLPNKEAGLFKAMLYSNKFDIDKELEEDVIDSGISHILTISSGSFFYIINIVDFMRKFYNKNKVRLMKIFFCIFLSMLASMEASVLRGLVIVLTYLILPSNIKVNKIKRLTISIYILLLINPYNIFNIGVIFSYLAVFSIMFFYNNFKSLVYFIIKLNKLKNRKILYKVITAITNSILLTFSILVFTLPVQICTYNSFNLIMFLSNILILPFVFFIQAVGYVSMFFVYFFKISNLLISSCFIPLRIICILVEFLSNIEVKISMATPSALAVIFYYLIIIFYILKENVVKKFVLSKKKLRIKLSFLIKVFSILFIVYIVLEQIYINNFQEYVYFFNVKQGNMCIIRKNKKTIIVDMGSTTEKLAGNIINRFLKAKNIKNIDMIFLTHMHSDHINGIYELDENIKIKNVAFGKIWHTINEEYNNLIEFINKRGIAYKILTKGDVLYLNDIKIECLNPSSNYKIESNDEINSNGAVYLVSFNKSRIRKILFMGDATKETEKYILNLKINQLENIDVFQVGHHGSSTSTSENFLKLINPRMSIISSYKKVYSHPSKEIIELLNKYGFKFYITEQDKAIKINI